MIPKPLTFASLPCTTHLGLLFYIWARIPNRLEYNHGRSWGLYPMGLVQSDAMLWQCPDKPAVTRLGTESEDDV